MAECEVDDQIDDQLAADRLAFFHAAGEGFRRAAQASGVIEKCYRVAGFNVCLRFAGPALIASIDPALAHLATAAGQAPDFSIELFDTTSTGTPMPLLVGHLIELIRLRWWERLDHRREIKGYHGGRIQTVFHLGPDILSILDRDTNRALYWIEDARDIPYYEQGYPLANLLNWWLSTRGRLFVHAAALGHASGGVLLPGKGGSGKSTTTLACFDSPLRIVGDDYCAVDQATGSAHSLYNTVKLKGDADVLRFSHLESLVSHLERVGEGEDREKVMIFLHRHFPDRMLATMLVRAILIPHISGRPETAITPASAAAALKALAPSTLFQLAGNERPAFTALAQMVRRIPAFQIALGTDIGAIPGVISRFLETTDWADRTASRPPQRETRTTAA